MLNQYDNIAELALNFVLWFILGATASYLFQTVVEYFSGRKD